MAKKQKVNKTQAVRDYLKTHPEAMSSEIAAALTKKGVKITSSYVANIKTTINKTRTAKRLAKKQAAAEAAIPAVVEKPTKNGDTITLEQIKKVAQLVRTMGGFGQLNEMLAVVKEIGGLKKFKDLADAMAVSEVDDIPF